MGTIAENLQIIKDATADIKQAIIDKGGSISGDISTWATSIVGISTGGGHNYEVELLDDTLISRDNYTVVNINDTVVTIEASSFYNCSNLVNVILPNSILTIGTRAFYGCENLKTINIPNNITSIGSSAFKNCFNLESNIVIPNTITEIEDLVFDGCESITQITLSSNLTTIGAWSFLGCISLTTIVMPPSLNDIGSAAFGYNESMNVYDFSSHTSIPTIRDDTFTEIPDTCKIVVPDELYNSWIAATNWSVYADNIISVTDYNAL